MKRIIALSLAGLLGASVFAGGGHPDLYATKGCHQEYNGYWGFGAGWNRDSNEFRVDEHTAAVGSLAASTYRFSAKEKDSEFVGHFFLGYSFYNDMPYSVALEGGVYSAGKKTKATKHVVNTANTQSTGMVAKGSAERQPAYYLALKPRYNSGDWWVNVTLGVAATTYRVKMDSYNTSNVNNVAPATLRRGSSDGFTTSGWMLGAGVGMWFNPNWAVSLDYDYMNWKKESSKTARTYNNGGALSTGALTGYVESSIKDGSGSHFVTLNLKNNFNWFA